MTNKQSFVFIILKYLKKYLNTWITKKYLVLEVLCPTLTRSMGNMKNMNLENIRKIGSMEIWKIGNVKISRKLDIWKIYKMWMKIIELKG